MKVNLTKLDECMEMPDVEPMKNSNSKSNKKEKNGRKRQKPRTVANRSLCIAI